VWTQRQKMEAVLQRRYFYAKCSTSCRMRIMLVGFSTCWESTSCLTTRALSRWVRHSIAGLQGCALIKVAISQARTPHSVLERACSWKGRREWASHRHSALCARSCPSWLLRSELCMWTRIRQLPNPSEIPLAILCGPH